MLSARVLGLSWLLTIFVLVGCGQTPTPQATRLKAGDRVTPTILDLNPWMTGAPATFNFVLKVQGPLDKEPRMLSTEEVGEKIDLQVTAIFFDKSKTPTSPLTLPIDTNACSKDFIAAVAAKIPPDAVEVRLKIVGSMPGIGVEFMPCEQTVSITPKT